MKTFISCLCIASCVMAVLTGCSSSEEAPVISKDVYTGELKAMIVDFIRLAKNKKVSNLSTVDIDPLIESMESYREQLGEKVDSIEQELNSLKDILGDQSKSNEYNQVLKNLEMQAEQL